MNNNEIWPKLVGLVMVWLILFIYFDGPKK